MIATEGNNYFYKYMFIRIICESTSIWEIFTQMFEYIKHVKKILKKNLSTFLITAINRKLHISDKYCQFANTKY